MIWSTAISSWLLFSIAAAGTNQIPLGSGDQGKPNIVFILTDDQDVRMNSLDYMPNLQKYLVQEGTTFTRHYATIALCCPSRVSLWTGKAAHNTNVTDVNPPYGGYPKFVSQGFNDAWLPLWLQAAGYNTYYTGKLFNAHTVSNFDTPYPSGFTGSEFLLDPYTYQYLNATFQRNREKPVNYAGQYSTDVLAEKAYGFLEDAVNAKKPFHLTVATSAPHSNVEFHEDWSNGDASTHTVLMTPPIPAERHEKLFQDAVVPRTPNFNPDEPSGVSWISRLPKQNQTIIDANDHFYRNRLRALQAVDEIVEGVVSRLSTAGLLDNTYIIYSSDNGYHIGQHRLQPGKECGFEEDINVPFIVRGPGVPRGKISDTVTTHTDLAPTFLTLAGGQVRDDFDGSAIDLHAPGKQPSMSLKRSEHVNVEYWGYALSEGIYDAGRYWNNTYKSLRLIGNGYDFYYSVWCSGEHQLYDLKTDPYELHNLYSLNHSSIFEFSTDTLGDTGRQPTYLKRLIARLDSLLLVLKSCRARSCTNPWEVLHPDGGVTDLHAALAPEYDDFYELEQQRVAFTRCEKGYILESEGPLEAKSFHAVRPRGGKLWAELV